MSNILPPAFSILGIAMLFGLLPGKSHVGKKTLLVPAISQLHQFIQKSDILVVAHINDTTARPHPLLDSAIHIPQKYAKLLNHKIEKYSHRLTSKTEKTLTRLSRWENKIQALLQKASPQTAEKLFGNNQLTFSSLLQKLKEGEAIAGNYQAQYNGYLDQVTTSIKYLQENKASIDANMVKPLEEAGEQAKDLQQKLTQTEYIKAFIKEARKSSPRIIVPQAMQAPIRLISFPIRNILLP